MRTWLAVRYTRFALPASLALLVLTWALAQQNIVVDRLIGVGKNTVSLGLYVAALQSSLIFAYALGGSIEREKISVRQPLLRVRIAALGLAAITGGLPLAVGAAMGDAALLLVGAATLGFLGTNLVVAAVSTLPAGASAAFLYLMLSTFAANQSGQINYAMWPLVGRIEPTLFVLTTSLLVVGVAVGPWSLYRRASR
ncbi:hypothetical protein JT358_08085 [Micrococcales bacterium 31B]|nr:hypothetical protein [Micrococcales bacterium 31B]